MKNILVCTDGSSYAHETCKYAAWIHSLTNASIGVLYVTDLRTFEIPAVADLSGGLGFQPFEGMVAQLQNIEEIKANFVKEQAFNALTKEGVPVDSITFHHETGLLVDVMSDHSDVADIVLLGKRGENVNFATEHLGSSLERVLRTIDKPCLVTNRKFNAPQKVVIAYDGGDHTKRAIAYLGEQPLFADCEIHVVVCVEGHKEEVATERLSEAENQLRAAGLYPKCQVLSGVVESVIADYVKDEAIDLLLLGAYGHSRIRDLLIGSTTTELLRNCHVPVLCFR